MRYYYASYSRICVTVNDKSSRTTSSMQVVEVSYIKRSMWAVRTGAKSNMNEYENL